MKLNLKIVEADNIPKMDLIGKADPFVTVFLTESKATDKTEYKSKTYTPKWDKQMFLEVVSLSEFAKFELRDHDANGKHDLIGTFQRRIKDFQPGIVVDEWINVDKAKGVKKVARIHIVSHLAYADMCPFYQIPFMFLKACVNIQGVRGIVKTNSDTISPYILIGNERCKTQRYKTKDLKNVRDPVWNEDFPIELTNPLQDSLNLLLRDKSTSGDVDSATVSIPVNQFQMYNIYENEFDMTPLNGLKSAGKIKLKIQVLPLNQPNWSQPMQQMYPPQGQPQMYPPQQGYPQQGYPQQGYPQQGNQPQNK